MSLVPAAAALIRQAAVDENAEQELHETLADEAVFAGLINAPIAERDLPSLRPSEWLWFAFWRQGLGAPLDAQLIEHLDATAADSRAVRAQVRQLVMRDAQTELLAAARPDARAISTEAGLSWLQRHATHFPDSAELARDALQYATESAWFVLRVLTAPEHPHAAEVQTLLAQFARDREISPEVTQLWTAAQTEPRVADESNTVRTAGWISDRLRRAADRLSNPIGLIGAGFATVPVMGSDVSVGPAALVLPPDAESILIKDAQTRATVGGATIRIWISGRWVPAVGSRIIVGAVTSAGEVVRDEAVLTAEGRLRFVLPWEESEAPHELLIAVLAA